MTKDINDVLDEFAHQIAKDAEAEESLEQKVAAFRALTAYATLKHKIRMKTGDEDDGETTMDDLRKALDNHGERRNGRSATHDA